MVDNPYIHNHNNPTFPCKACIFEEGIEASLKEVGKWLEKHAVSHTDTWGNTIKGFWREMYGDPKQKDDWHNLIEVLTCGKIPEV